jgi:hypothetical protein
MSVTITGGSALRVFSRSALRVCLWIQCGRQTILSKCNFQCFPCNPGDVGGVGGPGSVGACSDGMGYIGTLSTSHNQGTGCSFDKMGLHLHGILGPYDAIVAFPE